MSDRPIRQEIDGALKRLINHAESNRMPSRGYTWHRRFVLGIDRTLETLERRLDPKNLSGITDFDKAAEMTLYWLQAQAQETGSVERSFLLGKAQELLDELLNTIP